MRTEFGAWLRSRRRAVGLTAADVGAAISVDPSVVHKYERGAAAPSVERLWALGEVLGWDAIDHRRALELLAVGGGE